MLNASENASENPSNLQVDVKYGHNLVHVNVCSSYKYE